MKGGSVLSRSDVEAGKSEGSRDVVGHLLNYSIVGNVVTRRRRRLPHRLHRLP